MEKVERFINYRYSIECMITTIQIHDNVKNELDRLKQGKQTYEEVILNIIKTVEYHKRNQKHLPLPI